MSDWALPIALGGLVASGIFALLWLADDIEAFRESHRPTPLSDDEIASAGDAFLATFNVPKIPHGSGDTK
jgi:hypothetical protein